jgi:hypothetical protein
MFIINPYRFGTTTPFVGILDLYPGAAYAYSTRKLSSTYNGPALKLRETITNVEGTVAFDTNNEVSMSSIITITNQGTSPWIIGTSISLSTFAGSSTVYVTTWYDQSGNGKHLSNGTSSSQPIFVTSGTMETVLGSGTGSVAKPAIRFSAGSSTFLSRSTPVIDISSSGNSGTIAVSKFDVNAQQMIYSDSTSTNSRYGLAMQAPSTGVGFSYRSGLSSPSIQVKYGLTTNRTKLNLHIAVNGPYANAFTNANVYENGSIVTNVAQAPSANFTSPGEIVVGRPSNATSLYATGKLCEIISYTTDISSNRTGMETNVNNYYNMY